MFNPNFSVAGMPANAGGHHGHPNWNNPAPNAFADSLAPPRGHYQPGYMLSASQNHNSPQGNQRADEVPVVPTKAKLNNVLSRGPKSDFGMSSMFESSRKRQTITDEDAPPTASVNDLPSELPFDTPSRTRPKHTKDLSFPRRHARTPSIPQAVQPSYIIVFGYPPDKFSQTVEYFKSLGESTDVDPNTEITNCFRIGYKDAGDALRAIRKNGEVLGGAWMVGAKWADPAQAEVILGQAVTIRGSIMTTPVATDQSQSPSNAMAVDSPSQPTIVGSSSSPALSVGTPLKLAPSSSAFRRPGSEKSTPHHAPNAFNTPLKSSPAQASPSKGMLGQVSDLIFGW